ncbi:hypothetical protein ACFL35_04645 [Candidatus Riflebacteria bacterium]
MEKDRITAQIEKNTLSADKNYGFDEEHNHLLPAEYWFQNAQAGLCFFIVFYTQACRWSQCLGCNLPSKLSKNEVSFKEIMKQSDFIFDFLLTDKQKMEIKKVIVSNNGSVLDEETFSTAALLYFVAKMNMHCPNVSVLTLETRTEYVDWHELEVLHRTLNEGYQKTDLEIALGFEAFDEKIRNEIFKKGLSLDVFEKCASLVVKYGFRLKTYFMLKPIPGLSEEEGIEDIKNAIDYLDKLATKLKLKINMHLNPTYVAMGTVLEKEFSLGNYKPPLLESVRKAILHAKGKNITIYVGLNDEGLAVEGGSFIRPGDEKLQETLDIFNQTQDFSLLET